MREDLDPSGEQARQWVENELARDEYRNEQSVLSRVLSWVGEQLSALQDASPEGAPTVPPVVGALLLAVLVSALVLGLSRVRENRRAGDGNEAVLGGPASTAADLRRQAEAALRDRRWNDAVVSSTRALARDGADRTLLSDAPSLTAHEVGARLAEVFPEQAAGVRRCADVFDAVRYGRYDATAEDAHGVREVCEALRQARPVLPALGEPEQRPAGPPAPLRRLR